MLDKNDLQAIANLMDSKLEPINKRLGQIEGNLGQIEGNLGQIEGNLGQIENDLQELKEAHEETRTGVNSLLDWAEECGNVIKFPLPKVK